MTDLVRLNNPFQRDLSRRSQSQNKRININSVGKLQFTAQRIESKNIAKII
jgi:hypothetical protein